MSLRGPHPVPTRREVRESSVRARYGSGVLGGNEVRGYLDEEGVSPKDSSTETFVAIRAELDTWRWAGVPIFLRHGKRLPKRFTEVQVQFSHPTSPALQSPSRDERPGISACPRRRDLPDRPNILTLRLQPEEAIRLSFGVKQPGGTWK